MAEPLYRWAGGAKDPLSLYYGGKWNEIGAPDNAEGARYLKSALGDADFLRLIHDAQGADFNPTLEQKMTLGIGPGMVAGTQRGAADPLKGLLQLGQQDRFGDIDLYADGLTGGQAYTTKRAGNRGLLSPEELKAAQAYGTATKPKVDEGGFLGSLGPIAAIANMIPGPWQPFTMALSAANSLDSGNPLGALTAAYGAYNGGLDGLFSGAGGMGAGADSFGNFDFGSGLGGTSGFTGGNFDFGSLLGDAGADTLGGNMDFGDIFSDWGDNTGFGNLDASANPLDFGAGWNPDAPNAYDEFMREAGINPSAPGALDQLKTWATNNPGKLVNILGKLGAAGLGAYGANKQSGALSQLAQQYQQYGAPSRQRFEAGMTPGFDPTTIPGYAGALDTASKNILARLSAQGGNPFGNPGGLIEANKQIVSGTALPAIQQYLGQNAAVGFGAPMQAALNLQTQGIGADANVLNALGYGLQQVTNPQQSLADLLKQFKLNDGTSL